ncbi:hypothetical protein [Candidatus Methylobacter oryzae]|uniref:Peptidase A1 domain-containing protein n=1 Tax=Candidatus Methylobacter oryzae TaxID=2497749 RepID=A0ABY3CAN3_9GAMM|nr:hypothetical protein [Candidatus Methylobacter oryzae]TRW95544.1 hypothetical protein EKO24_009835 [Candidatus Methylobacter oryzae]
MTNYATPINIPFDQSITGKFKIKIGIANQTNNAYNYDVGLQVQIDTGSCGIVIPAAALYQLVGGKAAISAISSASKDSTTGTTTYNATHLASPLLPGVTTKYEPAAIIYQPSGDSIIGYYYYVEALGIGDDGNGNPQVIAKNVKVIGAISGCPFMMGVGFDRPMIADNAFLANLISAKDATLLYPSYYLDHQTVQLGLNPSNPNPSSFAFQTLITQTKGSEGTYQDWSWSTPQGTIAVTGANETTLLKSTPVSLLIDTGLDLMMVNNMGTLFPSPGTNPDWNTANIALGINANSGSAPSFSFPLTGTASAQLSPGNAVATTVYTTKNSAITNGNVALLDNSRVNTSAPTLVHVISNPANNAFINTGFNPLFAYGMVFDPSNNQVGFKSLEAAD